MIWGGKSLFGFHVLFTVSEESNSGTKAETEECCLQACSPRLAQLAPPAILQHAETLQVVL